MQIFASCSVCVTPAKVAYLLRLFCKTRSIISHVLLTPPLHEPGKTSGPSPSRLYLITMSNISNLRPTALKSVLSIAGASEVLEDIIQGTVPHLPRGPFTHEWQKIAQAQNVFVYEEHSSGIRIWNDHIHWKTVQTTPFVIEAFPTPPAGWSSESLPRGLMRISIDIAVGKIKHSIVSYQVARQPIRALL